MRIRDPEWKKFGYGIRDGKMSDPGSGKNIPDPQHWKNYVKVASTSNKRKNFLKARICLLCTIQ
jgi:hypothetical protein